MKPVWMPRAYMDSTRNVTTEIFYPDHFPLQDSADMDPHLSPKWKKKGWGGSWTHYRMYSIIRREHTHTHAHPEPSSSHVSHSSQHTLISAQRGVPDEPLNPPDQRRLVFQRRQPETHMKCCLTFRGERWSVCVCVRLSLCVWLPARWPWSGEMRVSARRTAQCLNFLSEPLPDVELPRAAWRRAAARCRGRRCRPGCYKPEAEAASHRGSIHQPSSTLLLLLPVYSSISLEEETEKDTTRCSAVFLCLLPVYCSISLCTVVFLCLLPVYCSISLSPPCVLLY